MEILVELSKIIINEQVDQQIIVLSELNGDRNIPIVIGISEILAIDRRIKGFRLPRPMTHDMLESLIDAMGGTIQKVVITDLDNHTFFAKIVIEINGKTVEVDSRPSDAMALCAGLKVPIFVDDRIFDKL